MLLALAGDTMLGRGVADRLREDPAAPLLHPAVAEIARAADLFVLNLECCISARGAPVALAGKPFFFRAPPVAAERLAGLGVAAVTLANNHVLDYGEAALADTLALLHAAGVATVGAGADLDAARAGAMLRAAGEGLRVVAVSDHPREYAAAPGRPGIAYADLRGGGVPPWLREAAAPADGDELVLVAPHWGPNMTPSPVVHVRAAADVLAHAGATLVAGHSAHVPQGVRGRTLFDLGDFLDDYRVDAALRNDLSLLWLVTLDAGGPRRVEGVPLELDYAFTRLADDAAAGELAAHMVQRCAAVGCGVRWEGDRLVFERA